MSKTFKQGNYNETTGELSNVTNLSIYETKSVQANWNKNYVNDFDGETRTVDVHVRRLREKIEPSPSDPKFVHTKWGVGYYFQAK